MSTMGHGPGVRIPIVWVGNTEDVMVGLVRRAVWLVAAGVTFSVLFAVDVATGQLVCVRARPVPRSGPVPPR